MTDSVALAIGAYPPSIGGAQLWAQRLAHELTDQGQRVTVFTQWRTNRSDWVDAATQPGANAPTVDHDGPVEVRQLGLTDERLTDPLMRRLYLPLRSAAASHFAHRMTTMDGAFDSVHVVRLGRENLAIAARDVARHQDIPFILTALHHPRWSRWWWPDPVWRRLYREADLVIALTAIEAQLLIDLGVKPDRIEVMGVGPHLSQERQQPTNVNGDAPFVLFLGQQFPYKRLDLAVAAFDVNAANHPDLRLVVAGPPHPTGTQVVEQSAHRDRIDVLGAVSEPEKAWLLANAQALVFPSEQESFGGVVVEAAVSGCPVVAGPIRQVSEVVSAIGWGTVTDGSASELADALNHLLKNPPSKARRNRAAERATTRYSWPTLAAQYARRVEGLKA